MDLKELKAKLAAAKTKEGKVSLLDSYAEDLFEKGKYPDAGRFFAQALALAKAPNTRAYLAGPIGICNYNSGNDKEALAFLMKSARWFDKTKPEFMPDMCGFVYFHLGSLFEYQGKQAKSLEARHICERYAESQEKDTKWMLFAGISRNCETLGRHDEAIQYSQKAIQILSDNDPSLSYLYESMGKNHMSLQQHQEAINYFSKVIDLDPNFERRDEIQLKVAECYHQLTNHRSALETYGKILELKQLTGRRENLTWLYVKLAHCHFSLDQFEKSLLMTLEALRRQPKDKGERAELRSYLTTNYYEIGRYKEAILEGEKTLKLARRFPEDSPFYFRLALAYFKTGDMNSFTRYRTLCRKLFPEDSWNKYLEKLR